MQDPLNGWADRFDGLPETQTDAVSPEEQAQHIAAIEAFLANKTQNPEVGESIQPAPEVPEATPEMPATEVPEPKLPETVHLQAGSPFTPPGMVFLGVGKNSAEKAYSRWLSSLYNDAMKQTGKEEHERGQGYYLAMNVLYTLILIAKAKLKHPTFQLIYTGPTLPRKLKIEPVILGLVETHKDILLALAPYFGLGSSHVAAPEAPTDEVVEKLPEPEILDAAPDSLFALRA